MGCRAHAGILPPTCRRSRAAGHAPGENARYSYECGEPGYRSAQLLEAGTQARAALPLLRMTTLRCSLCLAAVRYHEPFLSWTRGPSLYNGVLTLKGSRIFLRAVTAATLAGRCVL